MKGRCAPSRGTPLLAATVAVLSSGCLASPSPLAPQLGGSVGSPSQGTLQGGEELPRKGPGFERYRPWGRAHWGTPALVRLVQEVAARVELEAPSGAPLVVGDLSAKQGGRIPRHSSHRTGRDVDFLWYVTTPAGVPVRNPGFIHMGPDGLAPLPGTDGYLKLDERRQWLLFKALLTSRAANVQWLFVSRPVEAIIIDYAQARGEPLELIWHAENVMRQPRDAAPHADHVHVRIACSEDEAVLGCYGGGPHWEWLPPFSSLAPLAAQDLAAIGLDDPWLPEELAPSAATLAQSAGQ